MATKKYQSPPPPRCKNCVHWHNKQRELNYSGFTGFCLNGKNRFNVQDGRTVGVVDLGNQKDRSRVTGNPSHDFEGIESFGKIHDSRYLLATNRDFGCVMHERNKDGND